MKSQNAMNQIEIIESYQQDLKYLEKEIAYLSLDLKNKSSYEDVINQLKEQIKDKNKDIEYHFERISEILGFEIKEFDIQSIYSELEIITNEEKNLNDMCDAWDSEDPCAMACNDPGLQFEQGEVVEELWKNFNERYSNKSK